MNADDIFDVAIAIAREVVDEQSLGVRLRVLINKAHRDNTLPNQSAATFDDIVQVGYRASEQAASEFAAPYLARIAELEAELRARTAQRDDHVRGGKHDVDRIAKLESENKALRDAALFLLEVPIDWSNQLDEDRAAFDRFETLLRGAS
jgi:hypothetical protein